MVAALSPDVRWRIIWKRYESDLLFREISSVLNVDPSSVSKYLQIFEKTGDVLSKEELLQHSIHARALPGDADAAPRCAA